MRPETSDRNQEVAPPAGEFHQGLEEARAILCDAADAWAEGDPECPATLAVLVDVLRAFANRGLLAFPGEPIPVRAA